MKDEDGCPWHEGEGARCPRHHLCRWLVKTILEPVSHWSLPRKVAVGWKVGQASLAPTPCHTRWADLLIDGILSGCFPWEKLRKSLAVMDESTLERTEPEPQGVTLRECATTHSEPGDPVRVASSLCGRRGWQPWSPRSPSFRTLEPAALPSQPLENQGVRTRVRKKCGAWPLPLLRGTV